jgi:hypothetical protein
MAKKKNLVGRVLIRFFKIIGWTFKGIWYVVRGISQAFWWLDCKAADGIRSLLGRKKLHQDAITNTSPGSSHAHAGKHGDAHAEAGEQHAAPEAGHVKKDAVLAALTARTTTNGDFNAFNERLSTASLIILIAGKRGSGKSALGFRILENVHAASKRPAAELGVSAAVLPTWISAIEDVENVENGAVVLVDEGAVAFSSRESMSGKNKELGKLLAIARHKDLTLILITQNTGMIDKNVLNLCDTIILKEGSLLQQQMERDAMKEMYRKAGAAIKKVPAAERQKHAYIIDSDFEGLVSVPLPSFWNEKVSKNRA